MFILKNTVLFKTAISISLSILFSGVAAKATPQTSDSSIFINIGKQSQSTNGGVSVGA